MRAHLPALAAAAAALLRGPFAKPERAAAGADAAAAAVAAAGRLFPGQPLPAVLNAAAAADLAGAAGEALARGLPRKVRCRLRGWGRWVSYTRVRV